MTIVNGVLQLLKINTGLHLPIDQFFHSLALEKKEQSIGIILSGMGNDGTEGAKSIKNNKGFILVQDPEDAKFNSMPINVTKSVHADIIAPVVNLPEKLLSLLHFDHKTKANQPDNFYSKKDINQIIEMLKVQTGNDFSMYKKSTLFRRIERRVNVHHLNNTSEYVQFLHDNPIETEILFKELLIGVTSFFRDKLVWEMLKNKIIPSIIQNKPADQTIRAWISGCSTGEEAYSLAITFKEVMESMPLEAHRNVQIFATDLDQDAIEKARKGFFNATITEEISSALLNKYFNSEVNEYKINSTIREMVVFAPHNTIKDPPFTKLDIMMCRNMLIYMEAKLQEKLIALYNYSLNVGGILVLGSAETIGNHNEDFEIIDARLKIYQRNNLTQTSNLDKISGDLLFAASPSKNNSNMIPKNNDSIQSLTDQVLLQQFAPASVLTNQKGDIIYIVGRTGKYLEPKAGSANWNIYTMAREGINEVLPTIFRQASQSNSPITIKNLKIGNNGESHYINLTVQMLEKPLTLKGMYLIVFTDLPDFVDHFIIDPQTTNHQLSNQQIEFELELKRTYDELRSTREEMQSSQEELKSANEELQSTNEELQSTNEELTTSKEELQSLNEELQTVNTELQSKVSDLEMANNDMKNLLNSTEIATLFLDKSLNVRRFTDQVTHIFKLRNIDIGRPFTELVNNLKYPEIADHANQVIRTLIPIETEIITNDNRWFKIRIMPYRTLEERIDGLVITFSDISNAKKTELELKTAYDALQNPSK
jgi:two-component system CheB/CheR fusion protein